MSPTTIRRRHPLRWLLLALVVGALAAGAIWLLANRDDARAWRQAVTIGATLAGEEAGAAAAIVGWFDSEPGEARVREVAGLPAVSVAPDDGERTHPVVVVLVPQGATEAELEGVREVQHALARAGIAGWALRTPNPGRSLGDDAALAAISDGLLAVADDPGTRRGRIAVAASGALASLALVAASQDQLAPRIDAVLAVQPVADVQGLVRLAVTGTVRRADGSEQTRTIDPRLRAAAGRAVVQAVRAHAAGDSPLLGGALDAAEASEDPIATLARLPRLGSPVLQSALQLLRASTSGEFDQAWEALPADVRRFAEARSPLAQADRVDARVLLVVPADDDAYPAADSERLVEVLRDARLQRTSLLDPGATVGALPRDEVERALDVSAWWLRRAGS